MIKTIAFIFSLLVSLQLAAQLDSLERQLADAEHWKQKINAHYDLSSFYKQNDTSKVMYHINEMMGIAEDQNDDKGRYQAHTALASFYSVTGRYALSDKSLQKAYEVSLRMNDPEATSGILGNIGVLKYYMNEMDSAKYYLDTAYNIKKTIPDIDQSNLSRNLNSLSEISSQLNQFENAVTYQMEALKHAIASKDPDTHMGALNGLASLYHSLEDDEKAFQTDMITFNKAVEYGDLRHAGHAAMNLGIMYHKREQIDSIQYYLDIAQANFSEVGYERGLSELYIFKGEVARDNSELEASKKAYLKSLSFAQKINDDRLVASSKTGLGSVYHSLKEYRKAKSHLLEGLTINKELKNSKGILKSYYNLKKHHEETNDYQNAYKYQSLHYILTDSIDQEKFNEKVKSLEFKFETEIKDSKIERQSLVIKNQNNKQKVQNVYMVLFLLLGSAAFLFLFQRIKKNKIIAEKNLQIKNQKILDLNNENKILAMSSMIEGQEAERKRIAQDLHDGLGGLLSTAKIQIKNLHGSIKKETNINMLFQTEGIIESAYSEVRRISHNLMPGALVNLGLFPAIEDLADQINGSGKLIVNTQWYTPEDIIPEKTKTILYRIIQEAITNSIKYAQAEKLIIQMSENDGRLNVTIEDDGIGFNTKEIDLNKSLGLKSIKSRVEYLNGELEIISSANNGTSIEIVIPL